MEEKKHSNEIVAQWMLDRVEEGPLYQQVAATQILEEFGKFYVHENPGHPLTIQQGVLRAFKHISSETVVWEENRRCWRMREDDDSPDRTQ